MTAEELLSLPDDHMRHELIEGEVTSFPLADYEHGKVVFGVVALVSQHLVHHPAGHAFAAGTGFQIAWDPDTVRAPDLAFVSNARVGGVCAGGGFGRGAPDFAVEVISPDDAYAEVDLKVEQWLRAGARLVWVVNTRTQKVMVHTPDAIVNRAGRDTLDGGDVLRGFSCSVAELFV
jgi:Uma2 family endonuclease